MKLTFERDDDRFGLPVAGRHHVLECALCDRAAADVIVHAHSDTVAKFQAECPCGGRSPVVEVRGSVSVAAVRGSRPVDFGSELDIVIIKTEAV